MEPMTSAAIPFRKMNGLGNEIVVVDLRGGKTAITPEHVRRVAADAATSFDQMMVLRDPKTRGTAAFVSIFNRDGSESGACGNGMRCVGWMEAERTGEQNLNFETQAGILPVSAQSIDRVTVDMGEPRFGWAEIPLAEPFKDTRGVELQIGPINAPVLHSPSVVNVGNPHAIFWVDDVHAYDLARFGPMLENHPIFPERANISLAHVTSRTSLTLRTWERGAGLTQACGSAACAAAVCAARKKLTDRSIDVTLPGGKLLITWAANNRILMTGPAEHEFAGRFDPKSFERIVD